MIRRPPAPSQLFWTYVTSRVDWRDRGGASRVDAVTPTGPDHVAMS